MDEMLEDATQRLLSLMKGDLVTKQGLVLQLHRKNTGELVKVVQRFQAGNLMAQRTATYSVAIGDEYKITDLEFNRATIENFTQKGFIVNETTKSGGAVQSDTHATS